MQAPPAHPPLNTHSLFDRPPWNVSPRRRSISQIIDRVKKKTKKSNFTNFQSRFSPIPFHNSQTIIIRRRRRRRSDIEFHQWRRRCTQVVGTPGRDMEGGRIEMRPAAKKTKK